MGNFFLFVPDATGGPFLKDQAVSLFQSLKGIAPADTLTESWCEAIVFDREKARGARIHRDTGTGSWLLAIGTWFHAAGFASGDESRLLERCVSHGVENVAADLEGFFVLAFGDARSGQVAVVDDLVGGCHCYYRSVRNGLALSSSSAVLAALQNPQLDPIGAQEFIATGVVYDDRSIWRDVRKLGPAEVMVCKPGSKPDRTRYWNFGSITPGRYDAATGSDAVMAALQTAANRIGTRFREPLCDLTGGYDSRATIAGFLVAGVRVSTTVSGPDTSPDVLVSKRIASAFGLRHKHVAADWQPGFEDIEAAFRLTDGEYDLVEYARIGAIHRGHAKVFDVSINGSFGELARGYWWELLLPRVGAKKPIDAHMLAARRFAAVPFDTGPIRANARLNMVDHLTEVVERANSGMENRPNTLQMDHVYCTMRMQRWQGRIASSTNQIWPCLSPFAFRSVLTPVLESRWTARVRSLLIRTMLAKYTPRLAEIPTEHGYPTIPATPWNIYRFWTIPMEYGERAWAKCRRMLNISAGSQTGQSGVVDTLLRDGRIGTLAEFRMLGGVDFVDPTETARFAADSKQSTFKWKDQWCRLLTLEYALDRVGLAASSTVNDQGKSHA